MKSINKDIMLSNYKRKFTNLNEKNADIMIKYLKFFRENKNILKALHGPIYYSIHLGSEMECKLLICSNSS